ncbi:MAG: DUF2924 domain-containing protein [Candidatus Omnitrophica bacterium]|nr:DUF2924 domain-containing protein [Candidatus Omnitrophota bacterium]
MIDTKVLSEILALKNAPLAELQAKYAELYGGKNAPNINRIELWKKIAYKLQEREYGALSAEADTARDSLINEYDPINQRALRSETARARDKRLPIPGTVITKTYKGKQLQVKVLEKGFEYNGRVYRSIGAVAKAITGIHWSGYLFFNL